MKQDYSDISRQNPIRELMRRYNIKVKGSNFCCPFHDDKNPSAHLFIAHDGIEKGACLKEGCKPVFDSVELVAHFDHGGDLRKAAQALAGYQPMKPQAKPEHSEPKFQFGPVPEDVLKGVKGGVTLKYLSQQGKEKSVTPDLVSVYRDAQGVAWGLVARVKIIEDGEEKKLPIPMSWDVRLDRFVSKLFNPIPLFNAHLLAKYPDKPVLVVEGEKCVNEAQLYLDDWVLVTWQGGCKTVVNRDFSALDGRNVTFWPDADLPKPDEEEGAGERAMRKILERCKPRTAGWIEPPRSWADIKSGYDIVDHLERHKAPGIREVLGWASTIEKPVPAQATSRIMTKDWLPPGEALVLNLKDGSTKQCEANVWLFIKHHPHFKGRYRFDEFEQKVLVDGTEMSEAMLRDEMVRMSNDPINQVVTSDKLAPAIWAAAQENKFNPMGERLRELAKTWDGTTRYLLDYAGVEPTLWSQIVSRRWGIGLVRRIMEPGSKHDGVLILEGDEMTGKTTFLEMLADSLGPDTYTTLSTLHFRNNEAMALQGKTIVDMSELTAINKGDVESFKALTSQRADNYRIPWGKRHHNFQRTFVFAGTTNKASGYLTSTTGNRRIWPVKVLRWGDREALKRDLPQIWAELAQRALDGETSEMTGAEAALQRDEAAQREAIHPWQRLIEEWIELTPGWFPYEKLWRDVLEVPKERRQGGASKTVGEIMQKLGYEQKQARFEGRVLWGWCPVLKPTTKSGIK